MNKIKTFANWKTILLLFTGFLVFGFYLFPKYEAEITEISGEKVTILDSRQSYTTADVQQLFETLGNEGRELYSFLGQLDLVYPLVYGLLFFFIIINLTKGYTNQKWVFLSIIPLIATACDYAENFSISILLGQYPNLSEATINFASIMTSSKWTFVSITLLIIIILVILQFISFLRKKLNKK